MKEDIPRYIISQLGLTRDPLEGESCTLTRLLISHGIAYHSVHHQAFVSLTLNSVYSLQLSLLLRLKAVQTASMAIA